MNRIMGIPIKGVLNSATNEVFWTIAGGTCARCKKQGATVEQVICGRRVRIHRKCLNKMINAGI